MIGKASAPIVIDEYSPTMPEVSTRLVRTSSRPYCGPVAAATIWPGVRPPNLLALSAVAARSAYRFVTLPLPFTTNGAVAALLVTNFNAGVEPVF